MPIDRSEQVRSDPPPVIDFDHHSEHYRDHWREISDENLARCPIARSQAHGGFWLLSDYQTVSDVLRDDDIYSSFHDITGEVNGYQGIVIPPSPVLQVPIELDPPEFAGYRKLLNPVFSPAASKQWEPFIRDVTTACLDQVCESGCIDLVLDLANPVPAIVTMRLLGLPLDDWQRYAQPMHDITSAPPGSATYQRALEGLGEIASMLFQLVPRRRADPQDDMISRLATASIDGEPLSDERVVNVSTLIIAGGVDTTTTLLANTLYWLYHHPDQRQRLIDDPGLYPMATEEFLRAFAPTQALARTVTRDVEVGGQWLNAGDRVLLSFAAANRDPSVFDEPDQLRLDRFPNRHVSFGLGLHRCVGAHLARVQFQVMLEAVLTRMPDYAIDVEHTEPNASIGMTNGYLVMPATFNPSTPVGSPFSL